MFGDFADCAKSPNISFAYGLISPGRRGRRPLRGDEGLCVGAALAAARAGKTWIKENRGRIRIQGMVRIRPRSFVEGRLRCAGRRGRRPLRHDESFCALSYYATGPSLSVNEIWKERGANSPHALFATRMPSLVRRMDGRGRRRGADLPGGGCVGMGREGSFDSPWRAMPGTSHASRASGCSLRQYEVTPDL